LLKVFGFSDDKEIKKTFESLEKKLSSYHIEATLKKDPSSTKEEGYVEIYHRLRPGELATYDNARDLIDNMFFRNDRYDLAKVGRYKINQRLTKEDMIAIISEIISLNNNPEALNDDIDHLGNRRVRAVGEIVADRFRVGLMRMRRTIKDRMATLDPILRLDAYASHHQRQNGYS